ncbi:MAG: NfeD family protein [Moraxellaceae bacterium]|nr:NfeD family protein [Moraxellaceae bacterium]
MTPMMWLVIALVLAASELVTGNFVMLMLAAAAGIVAISAQLGLDDITWQIVLFGALSVSLTAVWYRRRPKVLKPELNRVNTGMARWLGRELVMGDGIQAGRGRVAVDDSTWSVVGPDCEPGTRVRVVSVEGTTLVVELLPDQAA